VKLLLNNKADPNVQNMNGDTILHTAIENDFLQIVDLLLHHKFTKNTINLNISNIKSELPLHIIFKKSFIDDFLHLLEIFIRDTNLNYQDENGSTIMHFLSNSGMWKTYSHVLKMKKMNV